MAWIDRLMGRRQAPRAAVQSAGGGTLIVTSEQLEEALRGGGTSSSGTSVTPEGAMKVGAVYACVRLISGAVATMPIEVMRRVDDTHREIATDHALRAILRRKPNRWQTPSQFKRMLTVHKLLRGNGYAQIVWSMGRVVELIPLHPDRVQVKQLADLSLQYVYTRPDGRQVIFAQADILHLMGLSLDGVRGVTPITYARETIGAAIAMERHGGNVFRNGAQIGGVFKHPNKLSEEAYDRLKSSIDQYRAEGERAGKSMILEEGMEYASMTMTAQDAQWIESRKLSRSDIAMFFGVPPSMIGDNSGSDSNWGTGLEQKAQGFVTFTLEDELTPFEETLERDCLTERDANIYVVFNRRALVKGDLKTRQGFYAAALQWGWMNPDEIRALEDLNPRADGKGGEFYDPPNTAGDTSGKDNGNDNPQPAKS